MKYLKLIVLLITLIICAACGTRVIDLSEGTVDNISYKETEEVSNFIKIETNQNEVIIIELYPEIAPITVENFQKLVSENFYDGTRFHRVIAGFMIQTGISANDVQADTIKGEFTDNGIENNLLHERGVISMARMGHDMDSASSQFFIMHENSSSLDGSYAAFGKVIAGMAVVDRIANVRVEPDSMSGEPRPVVTQIIRSIRFVTIEE